MYEIIGYAASVLVAISLMMSSILRLRIINLIGALTFAVYGILIGAVPVAAVNIFISIINIYYLARIFSARESFRIMRFTADSEYLHHFITLNRDDILKWCGAVPEPSPEHLIFFALRGVVPAGLFIGAPTGGGGMRVLVDYVLPGYRDFKVGDFVYRSSAHIFHEAGITHLETSGGARGHAQYLRRMGFTEEGGVFRRTLAA